MPILLNELQCTDWKITFSLSKTIAKIHQLLRDISRFDQHHKHESNCLNRNSASRIAQSNWSFSTSYCRRCAKTVPIPNSNAQNVYEEYKKNSGKIGCSISCKWRYDLGDYDTICQNCGRQWHNRCLELKTGEKYPSGITNFCPKCAWDFKFYFINIRYHWCSEWYMCLKI